MSYDVYLVVTAGGPEHTIFNANHTSNTARMWRKAGADLAEFDGQSARDLAMALILATAHMKAHPDYYKTMEPDNGWGDYDSTLEFLNEILAACQENPKAIVRIWR